MPVVDGLGRRERPARVSALSGNLLARATARLTESRWRQDPAYPPNPPIGEVQNINGRRIENACWVIYLAHL